MVWQGDSRSEMPGETEGLHSLITTPIIIDDYIYGVGSYGELRGLDARTGERVWMSDEMTSQARWAAAHIVRHGDRYFVANDDGYLIIARFTPEGYVELDRRWRSSRPSHAGFGRSAASNAVCLGASAFANRHVVQRNDNEVVRFSLDAADYR